MKLLNRLATWKVILPLSVLYILFPAIIFRYYQLKISEVAQRDLKILDLRMSYSWQDVKTLFDALGEEGRDVYRTVSNSVDIIYPIIYCVLLILILTVLIRKVTDASSKWMYFAFLPVTVMLFDFLENLSILKMLDNYPIITAPVVASASFYTTVKWSCLMLVVSSIAVLFVLHLIKRRNNENAPSTPN